MRQGCVLSPLLFNVYSEEIFKRAQSNSDAGIMINGEKITSIRYADDTVLIAESEQELQEMLTNISTISEEYGLQINVKKTKSMTITRNPLIPQMTLQHKNETIVNVSQFRYLGSMLNDRSDCLQEIKCRIETARSSFMKMKTTLCSKQIHIKLRTRLLRCYVFSVLYYGAETWTLSKDALKRIEAFEMWTYRRMCHISWIQRINNKEVLERMHKTTECVNTIQRRKLEYLGHIMRNDKYRLLQIILQGKINGRRPPGRRRISWLKNLRDWFGLTSVELFRTAVSRLMIANALLRRART